MISKTNIQGYLIVKPDIFKALQKNIKLQASKHYNYMPKELKECLMDGKRYLETYLPKWCLNGVSFTYRTDTFPQIELLRNYFSIYIPQENFIKILFSSKKAKKINISTKNTIHTILSTNQYEAFLFMLLSKISINPMVNGILRFKKSDLIKHIRSIENEIKDVDNNRHSENLMCELNIELSKNILTACKILRNNLPEKATEEIYLAEWPNSGMHGPIRDEDVINFIKYPMEEES